MSKTISSKLKDFLTLALLVFGVLALACSVHMHTGTQTLPSGAGHGMGPSFTANSHVHGNQPSLDVSKLAADEMSVTNGDFDFNGVFDFGGTALDGVTFDFEDFGCGVWVNFSPPSLLVGVDIAVASSSCNSFGFPALTHFSYRFNNCGSNLSVGYFELSTGKIPVHSNRAIAFSVERPLCQI